MKVLPTEIPDVKLIVPDLFKDDRGYFFESYNKKKYEEKEIFCNFVQDNQSFSKYGTLRGLHFQKGEFSQSKLVRVLKGRVLDVVLDIRKNSPTFGKHISVELSEENQWQLFIPKGFAHGFVVLSDEAILFYKCDQFYSQKHEAGVIYNDPEVKVDWQMKEEDLILSNKDRCLPTLSQLTNEEDFF